MRVDDFDFALPDELIAQTPLEQRDHSRLLVVHKDTGVLEDRSFPDILEYLRPNDVVVLNDTRVIPARLHGVSGKCWSNQVRRRVLEQRLCSHLRCLVKSWM